MKSRKKKPAELHISFGEALARFIGTNPKEVVAAVAGTILKQREDAEELAIYQFTRIRQSGGSERPDRRSLTMRRSPLVNQDVLPLSSFLG
jgi:hypothetical protein